MRSKWGLTVVEGLDAASASNQVCANDADVRRDRDDARPPADDVANEVDLLLAIVLCPKADAAEEERPVDRAARIRVRRRQAGVVLDHEQLQLDELLEEVALLGLLVPDVGVIADVGTACRAQHRSDAITCTHNIGLTLLLDYIVDEPDVALLVHVLVPVDLLLVERPLRQLLRVRPHRDLRRHVDELEVSGLALPRLALLSADNRESEECVIMPRVIVLSPSRELFVRRHKWRGNVVRE